MENTKTNEHAKLMTKLAKVIEETGKVEKNGKNTFHNYAYATESDIAEVIRTALAKNKVFVTPSVVNCEQRDVNTKSGNAYEVSVTMSFQISDAETGYFINTVFIGKSIDNGDKALYKAYTGAEKYFLLKTFLIPTGDDPEKESPEIVHTTHAAPTKSYIGLKMSAKQTEMIIGLLRDKNKSQTSLNMWVKKAFNKDYWQEMTVAEASKAIDTIMKTPPEPTTDSQVAEEIVDPDEVDKGIQAEKLKA